MKKTDLSYKVKKLLEPCKYWDLEHKKAFIPLVEYTTKLEEKVKKLEDDLRAIERPMLPSIFPEGSSVSRSFITPPEPTRDVMSRDERVWKAIKEGKAGTEEFNRMLKWSRLTENDAYVIYALVEKEKEKEKEKQITG